MFRSSIFGSRFDFFSQHVWHNFPKVYSRIMNWTATEPLSQLHNGQLYHNGLFLVKDMQNPPPFRNSHVYKKNAQCAETKEKSSLRFLVSEIWSFKILRLVRKMAIKWPNYWVCSDFARDQIKMIFKILPTIYSTHIIISTLYLYIYIYIISTLLALLVAWILYAKCQHCKYP